VIDFDSLSFGALKMCWRQEIY